MKTEVKTGWTGMETAQAPRARAMDGGLMLGDQAGCERPGAGGSAATKGRRRHFQNGPQESALASLRTASWESALQFKSGLDGVRLRTAPQEAALIVQVLSQVLRKNNCSFFIQVLREIFLTLARLKARCA